MSLKHWRNMYQQLQSLGEVLLAIDMPVELSFEDEPRRIALFSQSLRLKLSKASRSLTDQETAFEGRHKI